MELKQTFNIIKDRTNQNHSGFEPARTQNYMLLSSPITTTAPQQLMEDLLANYWNTWFYSLKISHGQVIIVQIWKEGQPICCALAEHLTLMSCYQIGHPSLIVTTTKNCIIILLKTYKLTRTYLTWNPGSSPIRICSFPADQHFLFTSSSYTCTPEQNKKYWICSLAIWINHKTIFAELVPYDHFELTHLYGSTHITG